MKIRIGDHEFPGILEIMVEDINHGEDFGLLMNDNKTVGTVSMSTAGDFIVTIGTNPPVYCDGDLRIMGD